MALEIANYVTQLIDTNPAAGDRIGQGDDHLRMIKKVLKNSFPSSSTQAIIPNMASQADKLLTTDGTDSSWTDTVQDLQINTSNLKNYAENVNALGSGGGTRTVNLANGNVVTATVSTSTNTFSFTGAPSGAASFTLILTNGGSRTVNWPASVKWPNGVAPTLTSSGVDIIGFTTVNSGSTWYGFPSTDFS